MLFKSVKLTNFRLHSSLKIDFNHDFNLIIGSNAVGKTSILEALSFLSIGKSPKCSDYRKLIKQNEQYFFIESLINNDFEEKKVTIYADETKKQIKIGNEIIKKASDFVGFVKTVDFYNQDYFLLNGSPRERMKLFDRIFCQISKEYLDTSNLFQHILKERNELLKRLKFENRSELYDYLDTIDEVFIRTSQKIIEFRSAICPELNVEIAKIHNIITNQDEQTEIKYQPNCSIEAIKKALFKNRERDIERGHTTVGPHRDEYIFIINNKNIVDYGSQGQQKNALLSLKIGFAKLLISKYKLKPVLLLDDAFSDLDIERQNNLLKCLDLGLQVIITTSTINEISDELLKRFNIIKLEKE